MSRQRRFKYGVFLHPEIEDPQSVLAQFFHEIRKSFVDPFDPSLGQLEVRSTFTIVRVDDSVVLSIEHTQNAFQTIRDDRNGPLRNGIKEALEWWNSETLLIAPNDRLFEWIGHEFPNAYNQPWTPTLSVQTITQYPIRLGFRMLDEWAEGVLYVPYQFVYEAPEPEAERTAIDRWFQLRRQELDAFLPTLSYPPGRPWFLTTAQHYRGAIMPQIGTWRNVGNRDEAEAAAEDYRGLCFLVDASTGDFTSRWAER